MPVDYLRTLTAPERTRRTNLHLGLSLAFVAGATNAGGFLAVKEYTSHMTGVVSSMADDLALGRMDLVLDWFTSLLAFLLGAATSAILINWARRRASRHEYALPLLIEATLLLAFGVLGAMHHYIGSSMGITVALLCFVMGLQNAMITKVSNAEIRTTHVTGLVTDIGIELGKMLYWNASVEGEAQPVVRANKERLFVHLGLVLSFFVGGVIGALGFKHVGYVSTVPLAIVLALLASAQFLPMRR
ncbi:membrane protein [Aquabacterium sp. NJ1]|uniref:YoaK family protein n=1 Tax=Aquabacterium sp. NJ1 TaxID=1538295 RepID=UPI00052B5467|nr:YoaK family protein [Aquabacterium sp. NJ1]KGM39286.1 membrane protein [Aquabacterium sp. NJ1]